MESLPSYFRLTSSAISEVISDVHLRRNGADIFFVFDPFDLIEFCFPIDPSSLRKADIGAISDDQAALFEVFFRRKQPAVLIREYEREVARSSTYLAHAADAAYDKAEILAYFARHLNLRGVSAQPDEKLVKLLQEDFTVILAAIMGLYSFGIDRFRKIVSTRLCCESTFDQCPPDLIGSQVTSAFAASKVTPLYDHLKEFLFSLIPRDLEFESDLVKRQQATENDAHAIDKLLQVNTFLENAFQDGKLKQRKIFLYLSSAEKTETTFTHLNSLTTALPTINGAPFNIWRTPSQVFASLIFKRRLGNDLENTAEDHDALAANLQYFHGLMKTIEDLYPLSSRQHHMQCNSCPLHEGNQWNYRPLHKEECPWSDLCRHFSRLSFNKQATELQNLGLLTNIQRYAQLSNISAKNADMKDLLEVFKRAFNSSGIIDIALTRLLSVQEQIATRSQFALLMSEGLETVPDEAGGSTVAREEFVSSPIQTLPIALQLTEPQYTAIVENFVNQYTGARSLSVKTGLLIDNYKRFLDYEKQSVLSSPEHELVRCLLYLAFDTNAGRELAMKHVSIVSDKFKSHSGYLKECHYILIWALRKNRCFREGERLAKEVIREDSSDSRMWHGRLLNAYEWRMSDPVHCDLEMRDLFEIGDQALEQHAAAAGKLGISEKLYRLLKLVLLNDVAFLYVVDNKFHDVYRARCFLNDLKELCPAELWGENNPEFLHTEAMITHREFPRPTSDEAVAKLKIALRNLDTAVQVLPKREFVDLAEKIRHSLERVELKK